MTKENAFKNNSLENLEVNETSIDKKGRLFYNSDKNIWLNGCWKS